jgi:mono/diheme cytochrome c family protein
MRRQFSFLLVLFLSLSLLAACGGSSHAVEEASSDGPPDAQAGKILYENFCLSCHGPAGKGDGPAASTLQPKPADLAALLQSRDDAYLAARISEGKDGTAMAAWKNVLNEAQIRQVVAYLRTLK